MELLQRQLDLRDSGHLPDHCEYKTHQVMLKKCTARVSPCDETLHGRTGKFVFFHLTFRAVSGEIQERVTESTRTSASAHPPAPSSVTKTSASAHPPAPSSATRSRFTLSPHLMHARQYPTTKKRYRNSYSSLKVSLTAVKWVPL